MKNQEPVHYRVFGCCVSGILACTLKYNYDCGLFDEPFSDKESEVTCPGCLIRLREWNDFKLSPAPEEYLEIHNKNLEDTLA